VSAEQPKETEALAPSATLADKIEWLIGNAWPDTIPPAKNNVEVATAITEATGEDISSTTVWKLRTGRQDNPQLRTLTALATFFDVPIGYFGFTGEARPIDHALTLKALGRQLDTGDIRPEVLRALLGLSPNLRPIIDEMILAAAQADRRAHSA
jgi:transcriptional regulator with XRE-family HTH domain